ncbi:hypothetical protein RHSIM_Rhsim12G0140300 [Rhododendron simsii]|uniref:Uncharacterized protein n=1 Tax=Rhododendron simsii TaxID=118357 RepID=A0A834G3I5_RHOSS|nr:hypothetical protein RHSIM_Rhsim12G0140300 [Rhododendron simsii]
MDREEDKLQTLISPLIDDNIQEHREGGIRGEISKTNTSTIHQKGIDDERKKKVVVEEVKKQLWLAGPLICVSFLQFCLQLISVMFVGHLGELALAGASMATSFASVTGFSILENWSFEMMVLASGLLPNPQLQTSVLSICLNTASTVWTIPFGLGNAVSTRVSNELGAGHPQAARLAVSVVLVMAVTEGVLVGAVLILIRNLLGYAYSNEVEVVRYVAAMMPILAISNLLDGLQSVLSGSVRGCGRQKVGAFVNLGSYYLVGIPCALLFAFVLHIGGKSKKATERVYDSIIPEEAVVS